MQPDFRAEAMSPSRGLLSKVSSQPATLLLANMPVVQFQLTAQCCAKPFNLSSSLPVHARPASLWHQQTQVQSASVQACSRCAKVSTNSVQQRPCENTQQRSLTCVALRPAACAAAGCRASCRTAGRRRSRRACPGPAARCARAPGPRAGAAAAAGLGPTAAT